MIERSTNIDRTLLYCIATPHAETFLPSLLPDNIAHAGIMEIQAAFGISLPKDLPQLAKACFGIDLITEQIHHFKRDFGSPDLFFAEEEFGYKIVPNFARLKSTRNRLPGGQTGQTVEAWTSPVLVPKNHILAKFAKENAVALFSQTEMTVLSTSEITVMLGFGDETPKHYIRIMRILDEPRTLAPILEIFGDNDINIQGLKQPTSSDGITTEVALIISPCPTVRFQDALNKISSERKLPYITLPIIE